MTEKEMSQYDENWAKRECEIMERLVHAKSNQPPKPFTIDWYKELVHSLSDDIVDCQVESADAGHIHIYIKTHYLDGHPTQDLIEWLRQQIQERSQVMYTIHVKPFTQHGETI